MSKFTCLYNSLILPIPVVKREQVWVDLHILVMYIHVHESIPLTSPAVAERNHLSRSQLQTSQPRTPILDETATVTSGMCYSTQDVSGRRLWSALGCDGGDSLRQERILVFESDQIFVDWCQLLAVGVKVQWQIDHEED